MVKACTFDTCRRRLAFGLFAGPSSGEWAWSRMMGQFSWQSDSGQTMGQWQKRIIYQHSQVGKLRASQRVITTQVFQEGTPHGHHRILPTLVGGGRPQPPLSHFYHHSNSFYHHSQAQKLQQMYFYCILAKSLALEKPPLRQFWAELCHSIFYMT